MKIVLPATLAKYSLTQASAVMDYFNAKTKGHQWTIHDQVDLISVVTGIEVKLLRRVDIPSIQQAFAHIGKTVNVPRQQPPAEVKLSGKKYIFEKDLGHKSWTAGRFIDADNSGQEIIEHPEIFVALCYIEKGKHYDDQDLNDRAQVMLKHFSGQHFIDLTTFFLLKYEQLTPGYSILQSARSQILQSQALKEMRKYG